MVDKKTLLHRLENGETIDDIAKEFTDALNEVKKTKDTNDKAKAKAEAEAKKKQEEAETLKNCKLADATDIADLINRYMAEYYNTKEDIIEAKDIVDLVDSVHTIMKNIKVLRTSGDGKKSFPFFDDFIKDFFF